MEDLLQTAHSLSSQSQRESSLLNLVMQFRKVCQLLHKAISSTHFAGLVSMYSV